MFSQTYQPFFKGLVAKFLNFTLTINMPLPELKRIFCNIVLDTIIPSLIAQTLLHSKFQSTQKKGSPR